MNWHGRTPVPIGACRRLSALPPPGLGSPGKHLSERWSTVFMSSSETLNSLMRIDLDPLEGTLVWNPTLRPLSSRFSPPHICAPGHELLTCPRSLLLAQGLPHSWCPTAAEGAPCGGKPVEYGLRQSWMPVLALLPTSYTALGRKPLQAPVSSLVKTG